MGEIVAIGTVRQKLRMPEPLWRVMLGARLRELRLQQGQKLTDVAQRAGISPQYLSEIERGRKEPSSEMVAAIAGALGTGLLDLTEGVVSDLRASATRPGDGPSVSVMSLPMVYDFAMAV